MNEEWRDVHGYAGRYRVSSRGRIRSLRTRWGCRVEPLLLRPQDNGCGYLFVGLSNGVERRTRFVHVLVADSLREQLIAEVGRRFLGGRMWTVGSLAFAPTSEECARIVDLTLTMLREWPDPAEVARLLALRTVCWEYGGNRCQHDLRAAIVRAKGGENAEG